MPDLDLRRGGLAQVGAKTEADLVSSGARQVRLEADAEGHRLAPEHRVAAGEGAGVNVGDVERGPAEHLGAGVVHREEVGYPPHGPFSWRGRDETEWRDIGSRIVGPRSGKMGRPPLDPCRVP